MHFVIHQLWWTPPLSLIPGGGLPPITAGTMLFLNGMPMLFLNLQFMNFLET